MATHHEDNITVCGQGADSEREIVVPVEAFELLIDLLVQMAAGKVVTVKTINQELTTHEAATFLNMSHPHLNRLLEAGDIPFRTVGGQRRVRFEDVRRFMSEDDRRRQAVIDQLAAEAERDSDSGER